MIREMKRWIFLITTLVPLLFSCYSEVRQALGAADGHQYFLKEETRQVLNGLREYWIIDRQDLFKDENGFTVEENLYFFEKYLKNDVAQAIAYNDEFSGLPSVKITLNNGTEIYRRGEWFVLYQSSKTVTGP